MKLTTAVVIAFAAASTLANSVPYKETSLYARDLYERGNGKGDLKSFEKRRKSKHKHKHKHAPSSSGQVHTGGYATYFNQYDTAGACGKVHSDNDLIAAIDSARYGPALCGKKVKITNPSNGKSVVVTVADECPGCRNANSIDLSVGAFKNIADLSQGVVGINWAFL